MKADPDTVRSAAYGLLLHEQGHAAGDVPTGMERIEIVRADLATLPALSEAVPLASYMRETLTDAGLRIDVLLESRSAERVCAVLLEPDGRRLLLACNPRISMADIRQHLTRYLTRRLLVARGALLLHGNLMEAESRCVAVLGRSGDGKSSLSVALLRAGAQPLADDVVAPVRLGTGFAAWPGFAEILIEEETIGALGIDPAACVPFWEEARPEFRKFALTPDPAPSSTPRPPAPLAGIFVLQPRGDADRPRLRRMTGAAAFAAVAPHAGLDEPGPHRATRTRGLLDLAGAVPVWLVDRPDDVAALDETARAILAAAGLDSMPATFRPEAALSPARATGGGSGGE